MDTTLDLEQVQTYTVLVDVGVEPGMGVTGFVRSFQPLFDPEGGMTGFFQVVDTSPGSVVVKIERELWEDHDYALERCPGDLEKGLVEQIKAEYEEAHENTGHRFRYFNVVSGPKFNDTLEG